jgi:hypothetical protein
MGLPLTGVTWMDYMLIIFVMLISMETELHAALIIQMDKLLKRINYSCTTKHVFENFDDIEI